MSKLVIVRGLPGSGKSTYAANLARGLFRHVEADHFFLLGDGKYAFDGKLIKLAHDWCYSSTVKALRQGYNVVVSNTFTTMWEIDRFLGIPSLLPDVEISVVEMRAQYGNIHNVPEEKLAQMAARWEEMDASWLANGIDFKVIE